MSKTADDIMRDAIIEQACAWQARRLDGELTREEKIEFLQWLQDNPRNVHEYLQNVRVAKLLPQAFAGLPVVPETSAADEKTVLALPLANSSRRPAPATSSFFRAPALPKLAAAVLIACGGIYAGMQLLSPRDSMTLSVPHGDQRTVRLADGSLMHLNSSSKARVRYSGRERLIELQEGQALFDVARDAKRPFRVRAGLTDIVALGTRFDVYRRSAADVTVTVVEGRVEVRKHGAASRAKQPVKLGMGQQLHAGEIQGAAIQADVNAATAWTRREIVFNGRPLEEVAEEFNRYLNVPVAIEDAALRQTRVSGMFSAYDEKAFLAFLNEFDGVAVENTGKVIRVFSRDGVAPVHSTSATDRRPWTR